MIVVLFVWLVLVGAIVAAPVAIGGVGVDFGAADGAVLMKLQWSSLLAVMCISDFTIVAWNAANLLSLSLRVVLGGAVMLVDAVITVSLESIRVSIGVRVICLCNVSWFGPFVGSVFGSIFIFLVFGWPTSSRLAGKEQEISS